MTHIRLTRDTKGHLVGYEVKGHTGAGESGFDLVCAAVSFLATTCANALESVASEKTEVKVQDGYMKVALTNTPPSLKATVILETFLQGANDLQDAYPEFVRLSNQAQ